nr:MAG TPA: hypothetical protein [Caudoviricetes sp.]
MEIILSFVLDSFQPTLNLKFILVFPIFIFLWYNGFVG